MRIISNFRDYYDVVQAQGQDRTLVYMRNKIVDKKPKFSLPLWYDYGSSTIDGDGTVLDASSVMVGFCGKVYPVFRFHLFNHWNRDKMDIVKFCFNLEDIDNFVLEHFKEKDYEGYFATKKLYGKTAYRWRSSTQQAYKVFFEKCAEAKDKHGDVFAKLHCPIFVMARENRGDSAIVTYNASLREHEFYRVFDPYQAFQEISMFLGAMAEPRKPIPPISDEVMAEVKGFDKWSFRKPPSTSKKRK